MPSRSAERPRATRSNVNRTDRIGGVARLGVPSVPDSPVRWSGGVKRGARATSSPTEIAPALEAQPMGGARPMGLPCSSMFPTKTRWEDCGAGAPEPKSGWSGDAPAAYARIDGSMLRRLRRSAWGPVGLLSRPREVVDREDVL
jgi:hypothetical protein